MTVQERQQLIEALIRGGYNLVDATNAANGSTAGVLYKEYVKVDLFEQFISNNLNRPLDFDKKFGNQCVDLMRCYIRDVLKYDPYTVPANTNAYSMFRDFPNEGTKYFKKVYNNPRDVKQVPPKGAILFWKRFVPFITGSGGHVAIEHDTDGYKLVSFDQNWPTNTFCHLQKHSYSGLWGWLVPLK